MNKIICRKLIVLLNLLLLTINIKSFADETKPQPHKELVTVGKVTESTESLKRNLIGVIVSPSVVNITSRISAEIEKVGFKEGGTVKQGQLLYQLDPIKYAATVKSTEAKIEETKAKLSYAELSYNRKKKLFSKKISTKDDLDSAQSNFNAYRAELQAAKAELITAENDLTNTKITAPISGQIGITNFTQGNYITPSSGTLATIVQLNPIRVRFTISNHDFLKLFTNEQEMKNKATVKLILADGKEYNYTGAIEFINNQANQNTDTIQIYAQFKNPDKKLIPGSIVTVELIKNENIKMAAILPSAVMHDKNGAYVYIMDKNSKIERRDVVLSSETPELQLVSKGLNIGENVVTDGTHKIIPGSIITPDYSNN